MHMHVTAQHSHFFLLCYIVCVMSLKALCAQHPNHIYFLGCAASGNFVNGLYIRLW